MYQNKTSPFGWAALLVVLGTIALLGYNYGLPEGKARKKSTAINWNDPNLDLTALKRPGLFTRLSAYNQNRVQHAAYQYCSVNYAPVACIHYLVLCGKSCQPYVTSDRRRQVYKDFIQLRRRANPTHTASTRLPASSHF